MFPQELFLLAEEKKEDLAVVQIAVTIGRFNDAVFDRFRVGGSP